MELRDVGTGDYLRLQPLRYEFPHITSEPYDSDWLIIAGSVHVGEEEWSFQAPILLAYEALELAEWLRAVSTRTAPPGPDWNHGGRGEGQPGVDFMEPNLAFAVESDDEDVLTLRTFLWQECAPPSVERPNMSWSTTLRVARPALVAAADDLVADLAPFPPRSR